MIRQNTLDTTVSASATPAVDAQANTVSPTLALLSTRKRDVVRKKTDNPRRTYHTWHLLLEEPLAQVAEQHNIPLPILLYKISPFWFPNIAKVEGNWDDQQTHLYQEAMKEATVSEILAYLMSVGLRAVY